MLSKKTNKLDNTKKFTLSFLKKNIKKKKIPTALEMLFIIVNRGSGDDVCEYLKDKGLLKLSCHGLGTADSKLQDILNISNKEKEVIISIIPVLNSDKLLDEIEEKFLRVEKYSGIAFTVLLKTIMKNSAENLLRSE